MVKSKTVVNLCEDFLELNLKNSVLVGWEWKGEEVWIILVIQAPTYGSVASRVCTCLQCCHLIMPSKQSVLPAATSPLPWVLNVAHQMDAFS